MFYCKNSLKSSVINDLQNTSVKSARNDWKIHHWALDTDLVHNNIVGPETETNFLFNCNIQCMSLERS